ncbi:single-stranded DNA-binding protein [Nonomuraea sp. NPDC050022]|uniref:single-stranded DNA-binding protein n=1 Tax=Nonomuraea sp. NPDC050022 TaxID=3364358 RepID=UPI0037B4F2C3
MASFTIASSRRVRDQATGEWSDGDTLFLRCSAFRKLVENYAESLTRGCRAVVTGRLKQRTYEDREGGKRTVFEVEVEDVGPSLKWASAKVVKTQRDQEPSAGATSPLAVSSAPTGAGPGRLSDASVLNVSIPAGGERVDAVMSWGLQHGLHLVAALDNALDSAAGWRVELPSGSALRADGPGGTLFDGTVRLAPEWRRAVTERGARGVLLSVGLRLGEAPRGWADALDRIAAVGRADRLAGGMVAVEPSWPRPGPRSLTSQ